MTPDGLLHDLFVALILGIVEGLTEFIPVSSSGHIIIVAEKFLRFKGEVAETFEIFMQLGAVFAILLAYRQRFAQLLRDLWQTARRKPGQRSPSLTVWHVIIATLPIVILGYFLHSYIKSFFTTFYVAIGVLVGAAFMLFAEFFPKKGHQTQSVDAVTYKQAFWVGIFQCFSLLTGFSRSGATISGSLLMKMDYRTAASFSFIICVPALGGASLYQLYKGWALLEPHHFPLFATGFLVSFLVCLMVIKTFLRWLPTVKLWPFAVYRIILGIVLLASFS